MYHSLAGHFARQTPTAIGDGGITKREEGTAMAKGNNARKKETKKPKKDAKSPKK